MSSPYSTRQREIHLARIFVRGLATAEHAAAIEITFNAR